MSFDIGWYSNDLREDPARWPSCARSGFTRAEAENPSPHTASATSATTPCPSSAHAWPRDWLRAPRGCTIVILTILIPATMDTPPLKAIETLVLAMLTAGDRHGYGIRQDILDHTGGDVEIEAGNLYRHIRALEERGLITDVPAPRSATDERRIYYRITPRGKRALGAELYRLRELVRLGEARGILAPDPG